MCFDVFYYSMLSILVYPVEQKSLAFRSQSFFHIVEKYSMFYFQMIWEYMNFGDTEVKTMR